MARPRKAAADDGGEMKLRILRDGVFIADDVRCDTGDEPMVEADVAAILIERGHAARV